MMLLMFAAQAQGLGSCPPDAEYIDGQAHLRALSLDLRGEVPDPADYDALVSDEVPEALIDTWLSEDAFTERVVRQHQSLFWNNLSNQLLLGTQTSLTLLDDIYYMPRKSDLTRGDSEFLHCGDFPTTFVGGEIVPVVQPDGSLQEGWVEVTPYWDPSISVRVCAFDANEALVSISGTPCDSRDTFNDPGCGCGPDLRWCRPSATVVDKVILRGFGEDVDRRVRHLIETDAPYTDLLTGDVGFVNGPMVHYFKHQTGVLRLLRFTADPYGPGTLPDLAFSDTDTWVQVDLPEAHAGVLTSPAFLTRFQTNRSRANRFYNDFICQPFQPPVGGIPNLDDPNPSLDLTVREGCKYCHSILEPAAAHWGRWNESGGGYLDTEIYPAFDEECAWCRTSGTSCSQECRDYYLTDPLSPEHDPYVGWLKSYTFLEDRHIVNTEVGPSNLVESTIADGRFQTCVTRRTAEWLLGRELGEQDTPWLDDLTQRFSAGGYQYRKLVRDIVMSDNYRRVR